MCVKKTSRCAAWRFRCLCCSSFKIWKRKYFLSLTDMQANGFLDALNSLAAVSVARWYCFSAVVGESELVYYISLKTTEIRVLAKINKCEKMSVERERMMKYGLLFGLHAPHTSCGCTARLTCFHRKSRHFLMPAKLLSCSFLLYSLPWFSLPHCLFVSLYFAVFHCLVTLFFPSSTFFFVILPFLSVPSSLPIESCIVAVHSFEEMSSSSK